MNKEQIIEEVGQEYTKWFYDNAVPSVSGKPILNGEGILTRGEFINKCKTDTEFSEKWGLKIEERELNDDELNMFNLFKQKPTRLITIKYQNEKIEIYE